MAKYHSPPGNADATIQPKRGSGPIGGDHEFADRIDDIGRLGTCSGGGLAWGMCRHHAPGQNPAPGLRGAREGPPLQPIAPGLDGAQAAPATRWPRHQIYRRPGACLGQFRG